MEWQVWISFVLLSLVEIYANKKVTNDCTHSGFIRNVNLEGGGQTNNYTIIKGVHSMKDCVAKCCHIKQCDLAMMKKKKCYGVTCDRDESCRITHSKIATKNDAEIAFITKPSSDREVEQPSPRPKVAAKHFHRLNHNPEINFEKKHETEKQTEDEEDRPVGNLQQTESSSTLKNKENKANTEVESIGAVLELDGNNKDFKQESNSTTDVKETRKNNSFNKSDSNRNNFTTIGKNSKVNAENASNANIAKTTPIVQNQTQTVMYIPQLPLVANPNELPDNQNVPYYQWALVNSQYQLPGINAINNDVEGSQKSNDATNSTTASSSQTANSNTQQKIPYFYYYPNINPIALNQTKNETVGKESSLFTPTEKQPTKDTFVTEIAGELSDSPYKDDNTDDLGSGADVRISQDGSIIASVDKEKNSSVKYEANATSQVVSPEGTNKFNEQELPTKYFDNNSNETIPVANTSAVKDQNNNETMESNNLFNANDQKSNHSVASDVSKESNLSSTANDLNAISQNETISNAVTQGYNTATSYDNVSNIYNEYLNGYQQALSQTPDTNIDQIAMEFNTNSSTENSGVEKSTEIKSNFTKTNVTTPSNNTFVPYYMYYPGQSSPQLVMNIPVAETKPHPIVPNQPGVSDTLSENGEKVVDNKSNVTATADVASEGKMNTYAENEQKFKDMFGTNATKIINDAFDQGNSSSNIMNTDNQNINASKGTAQTWNLYPSASSKPDKNVGLITNELQSTQLGNEQRNGDEDDDQRQPEEEKQKYQEEEQEGEEATESGDDEELNTPSDGNIMVNKQSSAPVMVNSQYGKIPAIPMYQPFLLYYPGYNLTNPNGVIAKQNSTTQEISDDEKKVQDEIQGYQPDNEEEENDDDEEEEEKEEKEEEATALKNIHKEKQKIKTKATKNAFNKITDSYNTAVMANKSVLYSYQSQGKLSNKKEAKHEREGEGVSRSDTNNSKVKSKQPNTIGGSLFPKVKNNNDKPKANEIKNDMVSGSGESESESGSAQDEVSEHSGENEKDPLKSIQAGYESFRNGTSVNIRGDDQDSSVTVIAAELESGSGSGSGEDEEEEENQLTSGLVDKTETIRDTKVNAPFHQELEDDVSVAVFKSSAKFPSHKTKFSGKKKEEINVSKIKKSGKRKTKKIKAKPVSTKKQSSTEETEEEEEEQSEEDSEGKFNEPWYEDMVNSNEVNQDKPKTKESSSTSYKTGYVNGYNVTEKQKQYSYSSESNQMSPNGLYGYNYNTYNGMPFVPTDRPKMLKPASSSWNNFQTNHQNSKAPPHEKYYSNKKEEDTEEGEREDESGDGDLPSDTDLAQSTRRSTIPWKSKNSTLKNSHYQNLTTTPTTKVSKSGKIDKKPSKKSLLPLLNQPMNMMQNPFQNQFEEENNERIWSENFPGNVMQRERTHHKKHAMVPIGPLAEDSDQSPEIPVRFLPFIMPANQHKTKHRHNHARRHGLKGIFHKGKKNLMINTGIKASSFLGQMLTGNAMIQNDEVDLNQDLTKFATQMALTNSHLKHHTRHKVHKKHNNKVHYQDPLAFGLPPPELENRLPFPQRWKENQQFIDPGNHYSQGENIAIGQMGQLGPSNQENGVSQEAQVTQENEANSEGQNLQGNGRQENLGLEYSGLENLGSHEGPMNTPEEMSQEVPQFNQLPKKSEDLQIQGMPSVENQQFNNRFPQNNYVNFGQENRQIQRIAEDLTPGPNEMVPKAENVGLNEMREASSMLIPQERFAQRHVEQLSNGELRDLNSMKKLSPPSLSPNTQFRAMPPHVVPINGQFRPFVNFHDFGREQHPVLNVNPRLRQRPALFTMGGKKDNLVKPDTIKVDSKSSDNGILESAKYFINDQQTNALKINITDSSEDENKLAESKGNLGNETSNTTAFQNTTNIGNATSMNFPENTTSPAQTFEKEKNHTVHKQIRLVEPIQQSFLPIQEPIKPITFAGESEKTVLKPSEAISFNEQPLQEQAKLRRKSDKPIESIDGTAMADSSKTKSVSALTKEPIKAIQAPIKLEIPTKVAANYQSLTNTSNNVANMSKGSHISWKTANGKHVKPDEEKDNGNSSSTTQAPKSFSASQFDIENKTAESSTEKNKNNDESEVSAQEKLNSNHEVSLNSHLKKTKEQQKEENRKKLDATVKKLSQELKKTAKGKANVPNHQFFHALKEVLINKLNALHSKPDSKSPHDSVTSVSHVTTEQSSTKGKTAKKKTKKPKIYHKHETKQSKIVKDNPNKDAQLLLADAKPNKKKERKAKGKYKEKKKKKKKQKNKTSQALQYASPEGKKKATHKKETENVPSKHGKAKKMRKKVHQGFEMESVPSSLSNDENMPFNSDASSQLNAQDDYGHGHPMDGHRYGSSEYQSGHKWANHDFSPKQGHYGMHNDTADNHRNNDKWAERDPNATNTKQTPKQFLNHLSATLVSMQKEKEITSKLNQFNSLASSLTSKLNYLNNGKGWRPSAESSWRPFLRYQKRLEGIKQARQEIMEHYLHPDPSCNRGLTVRGATLRGGILSGEFHSMGVVDTQKSCVDLCCRSKKCDVAMTIGRECINIKCFNKKMCTIAPAGNLAVYRDVLPVVTFIRKPKKIGKRSIIPRPFSLDEAIRELDESELEEIHTIINNPELYL
ncbi:uncharacterized protein LOC130641355 [Hydractinia symbiolongicarpus]|uniref:uncharacterized protein LOC130641355 n=1 Tax=Hydractinia symbiolongicarpus TaxID=13093 RepID=UPI00254A2B7F|nr:uncharacterized protein LOC130641355 [Hydractinia symbiolongicarpus]